jgi:hypothetical protein
VISPSLL